MSYNLFLDDQRGNPEGWTLVSTYDEFIAMIMKRGLPDHIAFDHDLGFGYDQEEERETWDEDAKSGYDCAKWIVNNNLIPKQFSVHSWAATGAKRIGKLMEESGSKLVPSPFPYKNTYGDVQDD